MRFAEIPIRTLLQQHDTVDGQILHDPNYRVLQYSPGARRKGHAGFGASTVVGEGGGTKVPRTNKPRNH